jgi:hypothetical protein
MSTPAEGCCCCYAGVRVALDKIKEKQAPIYTQLIDDPAITEEIVPNTHVESATRAGSFDCIHNW